MPVRIPHRSLQNCQVYVIVKLSLNRLSMNQERTKDALTAKMQLTILTPTYPGC